MRKVLVHILAVVLIALPACQKGDEDPYLSLRTRKNRLTGYWVLESYDYSSNYGDYQSIEYSPDDGELEYVTIDSSTFTRDFDWTMEFDNEGQYTSLQTEQYAVDTVDTPYNYVQNRTEIGAWEFTGGNGEPSKSLLLLLPEENSSTRSDQGANIAITVIENPVEGRVYMIDRLANDELWLSIEEVQRLAFEERTETINIRFVKKDPDTSDE